MDVDSEILEIQPWKSSLVFFIYRPDPLYNFFFYRNTNYRNTNYRNTEVQNTKVQIYKLHFFFLANWTLRLKVGKRYLKAPHKAAEQCHWTRGLWHSGEGAVKKPARKETLKKKSAIYVQICSKGAQIYAKCVQIYPKCMKFIQNAFKFIQNVYKKTKKIHKMFLGAEGKLKIRSEAGWGIILFS